jgi:hypothetical protein
MKKLTFFLLLTSFILIGCDNYDDTENQISTEIKMGTGLYRFEYQNSTGPINMEIYYHVPDQDVTAMPVLFVFHGNGRNAVEYRNAWIDKANEKGFIVITPKFSNVDYPGGDGYNLGNVFEDGDNPSASTLNPEEDWAFSVIEPLFDDVRLQLDNITTSYNLFGFSAGGQFVHRFVMFKPNARINKAVASASGWYTVPDNNIEFPYGIGNCPIENMPASSYYSKNMTLQIGTLDNDPNASALRRNSIVDQQGTNRYDRAFYMFNTSKSLAENLGVPFNWEIIETPGNDHDHTGAVEQAGDLLFQ